MHNERVTMLPKGTISLSEYIYFWSKSNNVSVPAYFKETLRANASITSALHHGIMGKGKHTSPIRYKTNNRKQRLLKTLLTVLDECNIFVCWKYHTAKNRISISSKQITKYTCLWDHIRVVMKIFITHFSYFDWCLVRIFACLGL